MNKTFFRCGAAAIALAALMPGVAAAQPSASPFTNAQRFDALGRVTGTISADPDGPNDLNETLPHRATRNTYDPAGNLTLVETGTLATWQSEGVPPAQWSGFTIYQVLDVEHDAMGRKKRETLSSGGVVHQLTQYSHDLLGRLECTALRMNPARFANAPANACTPGEPSEQGPDRISRNVYNEAGYRAQLREGVGSDAEAPEATWAYNPNGQVTTVIDGNGNRAELRYDGHGRQNRWVFPATTRPTAFDGRFPESALATAGAVNEGDFEAYTYDPNGNRTERRTREGQMIYSTYDALNRQTYYDRPNSAWWETDHSFGYDNLGRMTSASDNNGHSLTFTYDALGRQTAETSNWFGAVRSAYDQAGRREQLTWPDGFSVRYKYLDTGEMTSISESGGFVLARFGYDGLGRRTSLARGNGTRTDYTHDPVSRLASMGQNFPDASNNLGVSFTYNSASQIATVGRTNSRYSFTGHQSGSVTDVHNGLNQVTQAGALAVSHDARGNTTGIGTQTFGYTADNQLAQAPGQNLAYDPRGRLFHIAGSATDFLYDGERMIMERQASGGPIRSRFVHGPGVDEPLAEHIGGQWRYLHADERGSVIAHSDTAGNVSAINRYDEYGLAQGGLSGRFGYTGQVWLPEIGLYYYKARMYNPDTSRAGGRFMQVDTIGYGGGVNLYEYADSNPLNHLDPTGNFPETIWDLANAAMGAASAGENIARGNYGRAAVDIAGVVIDSVAAAVPVIPGGAGTAIRAVRASERVSGVAARGSGSARAADRAALRNAGVPVSRSRIDVRGPGNTPVPRENRQQLTADSRGNPVVVSRHGPHPTGRQPHDRDRHSHAATPRIDERGEIVRRKDGSVRYH